MPAARGLKRTASKASASAAAAPKIKKKHGVTLEVPIANKVRGRLLACGQGDVGQLGLGEDAMESPKFKFVSKLGEKIVDACAGGMHTVALDSDGKVWTFGCNDEGALGRQGEEFSVGAVALPEKAVAISAGDSHTASLLDNGHVYLWGSFRDSHGSMGLVCEGREGKSCREPIRLVLPEQAAAIASGGDHLIILTVTGAVYSAGCGEQGQLGRLSQRSASRHARQGLSALLVPTQVTLKTAVRTVWAGSHATLCLDANSSKVLACGLNNYNQLGVTGAKKKTALYTPLEADAFSSVINADDAETWNQVACGQHHSLALDNNGKCYAVGRYDYGRLGLGEGSGDAEALTPVPVLQSKKCVSIAASTSSSYAITDNGEVYAWGMGSEGQLGTGKDEDAPAPTLINLDLPAHKPVKVSAGGQHTILFVANTNDSEEEPEPAVATTSQPQKADKAEPKPAKGKAKKEAVEDVEVTSSNSAEAMEVDAPKKPEKKVNGEEEPTPMETDETDKPEDTSEKTDAKDITETEKHPEKPEAKQEEPKTEEHKTDQPKAEEPKIPEIEPKTTVTEASKPEPTANATNEEPMPESKPEVATPLEAKPESPESKPDITDPKPEAKESKAEVTESKQELTESKAEVTEYKTEVTESKAEVTESKAEATESKAEVTEAKSEDVEMAEKTVNGEGEEEKTEVTMEKSKVVGSGAQPEAPAAVAEAL